MWLTAYGFECRFSVYVIFFFTNYDFLFIRKEKEFKMKLCISASCVGAYHERQIEGCRQSPKRELGALEVSPPFPHPRGEL